MFTYQMKYNEVQQYEPSKVISGHKREETTHKRLVSLSSPIAKS